MIGEVVNLNLTRGFGFLKCGDLPKDTFFHASDLKKIPFDAQLMGRLLRFDVAQTPRGEKAINIEGF